MGDVVESRGRDALNAVEARVKEGVVSRRSEVYYVNVARSKLHVAYDCRRVFKVRSLTELKDAKALYLDVLFPEIYGEVGELLRRGVKIYVLRGPRVVKEAREENALRKNDENDARALFMVDAGYFEELRQERLNLLIMLRSSVEEYLDSSRKAKAIKQWIDKYERGRADSELIEALKLLWRLFERRKKKSAAEIIKIAGKELKLYALVEEELGLRKGSASLAILAAYVDFSRGLHKIKGYVRKTERSEECWQAWRHRFTSTRRKGESKIQGSWSS